MVKFFRASGEMTPLMDKAVLSTYLVCYMKEYGLQEDLLVSIRSCIISKPAAQQNFYPYCECMQYLVEQIYCALIMLICFS